MARNSTWSNADGLVVGFGTRTVEVNSAHGVNLGGQRQQLKVRVKGGSEIKDSDVSGQLLYSGTIPAGSLLESAKLIVKTAFAGTNAVMDIGTYNASTGAAVADNNIDSAIAVTSIDGDGDVITCDGAAIGTVLTVDSKVGITYDTAAFTAGEAELIIEYVTPVS